MWMYRFIIPCLKKNVCSACEFKGTAVGWEALVHAGLPSDCRALTRTRADPRDRGAPPWRSARPDGEASLDRQSGYHEGAGASSAVGKQAGEGDG